MIQEQDNGVTIAATDTLLLAKADGKGDRGCLSS
jgi:hypothetical protein